MQIRLTVLGPRPEPTGRTAACDVLVTAPAGTALAAVASGLAAVAGGDGPAVLYAGAERLDAQRCTLGEPPLVDGAVLALGAPADPGPEFEGATAQLHVVAGPDAGGVHLLHGGRIDIGRSADADVPLDDPDVSRLHCAVTVTADGGVSVTDLGSTNGTTLNGTPIGDRPVRLQPGALLRLGESALRLAPMGDAASTLPTTPDGEGHLRVRRAAGAAPDGDHPDAAHARATEGDPVQVPAGGRGGPGPSDQTHHAYGTGARDRDTAPGDSRPATYGEGSAGAWTRACGRDAAAGTDRIRRAPDGTESGRRASGSPSAGGGNGAHTAPGPAGSDRRDGGPDGPGAVTGLGTHQADAQEGGLGASAYPPSDRSGRHQAGPDESGSGAAARHERAFGRTGSGAGRGGLHGPEGSVGRGPDTDAEMLPFVPEQGPLPDERTPMGTPARGTTVPRGLRRRGGLTAWARRLGRGRDDPGRAARRADEMSPQERTTVGSATPEPWPDPAALLLTALGPGPRLWEREPDHPEALVVRLGTADRPAPGGSGLLPAVPVTVGLRESGALGLAGPRERLAGLARSVLAQLAALHSPGVLEIVLISTDRARPLHERTAEWSWLGWLPHLRPGHGQDCRLLLAYDREQAAARTGELLRRLDDHLREQRPAAVVVVDGDPGSAALREAVTRLAEQGGAAGIHVLCLAEAPAASPASPLAETYEAACAASPAFRACGAAVLLSGDVATALRLLRTVRGEIAGHGTVAGVDAVSAAWIERFARALAPLRMDGAPGEQHRRVSAPLPQAARLLDELGLARATPASLMARWAAAGDSPEALGGRAWAVLGAGPRGPVGVDLAAEGPHLLIDGPPGSGRTELLRSVAASLAAAERPDRLGLVLMDGRDSGGGSGKPAATGGGGTSAAGGGDGLRVCTDLPHVTTYLTANDPVRMRQFAQSLTAELKRRAELLGRLGFTDWHTQREVSGRMVAQRSAAGARSPEWTEASAAPRATARAPIAQQAPSAYSGTSAGPSSVPPGAQAPATQTPGPHAPPHASGDLDTPPSSTLRLRPAGGRERPDPGPPLPRLVVLVDDVDTLLSPSLGSPGRPAAGSVVRALEAVARDGERLGVHLVAATGSTGRPAETELGRSATLRISLDAPSGGADDPAPGRGTLRTADGRATPFQAGRVTGRIPRTGTLRPTVVALDWERMGDPPARRPVRELGNGPTDLALLASALERAVRSMGAAEVPSLL